MAISASDRDDDANRPAFRLGQGVALRRATQGLPAGLIGHVVGYYAGPGGVEYAISFEPVERLLRLSAGALRPADRS